jgi:hypothetical protein
MGYISPNRMRADVAQAIAAGSDASLLFAGQIIPVAVSPVNQSDDVDDDGVMNEADVEAVGVVTNFQTAPEVRDIVQLVEGGVASKYHVDRITRDESAIHLFLRRA